MIKSSCAAYLFDDRVVLHTYAITTAGFAVSKEPFLKVGDITDTSAIGDAVLQALRASETGVELASGQEERQKTLLTSLGVTSNAALQRSAKLCEIYVQGDTICLCPSHNGGTSGRDRGYTPLEEAKIWLTEDAEADEIGSTLLRCFESCTC